MDATERQMHLALHAGRSQHGVSSLNCRRHGRCEQSRLADARLADEQDRRTLVQTGPDQGPQGGQLPVAALDQPAAQHDAWVASNTGTSSL
jgi:hypothetical protein